MRREFLKGIGRALVVTTFAMLAVPAGGVAPARAASAQIEEITWALPGFPNTLLVAHEWNTYNGAIMSLVQEGLLSFDDKLALAPAVAESWQQVDPVTYKYKLRTGVTFQDGSPLTADDVVYTMAIVVKITRASVIEELGKDYVAFGRARGLGSARIIFAYLLRNALIPVVTAAGLVIVGVVAGAIYVEVTFALPGLGSLIVDAVQNRDIPMGARRRVRWA